MFRHVLWSPGMSYGRSGMFYFPTCRFVCSAGLLTHVLLRHVFWSLRHVVFTDMFLHVVFACFCMFFSACFISIRICCQVLGLRLCGRYGRPGRRHVYLPSSSPRLFRLAFLACLSPFFFRPAAFHTQLRPGAGLACGRYDRQGPTALEQRCATQT